MSRPLAIRRRSFRLGHPGAGEAEAREQVRRLKDDVVADPRRSDREDLESVRVVRAIVAAQVRQRGGLAVGGGRQHPPRGAAQGEEAPHELGIGRPPGIPVEGRRHLQHGVGGQQPRERSGVGGLERRDVPLDQRLGLSLGRLDELILLRRDAGKPCPGPLQAAVDRRHRRLQRRRDLRRRPIEGVAQEQDRALAWRQQLQGRDQGQPQARPRGEDGRRIVLLRAEQGVREGLHPRHLPREGQRCLGVIARPDESRREGPTLPALQRGEAGVRGDPVEPGTQRGATLVVALARPPGPQQRLLDQIFPFLNRPEHPVAVDQEFVPELLGPQREVLTARHARHRLHPSSLPRRHSSPSRYSVYRAYGLS
jgi:hypothetical protein